MLGLGFALTQGAAGSRAVPPPDLAVVRNDSGGFILNESGGHVLAGVA